MSSSDGKGEYSRVAQIQDQVDETQGIIVSNVDKMLDQCDSLDDLKQRTYDLEASTINFARTSEKFRCQMLWENWKINLIGAGICSIILLIIIVAATT